MPDTLPATRYRFGVFEADSATGELRRKGVRIKLHSQPFQILCMMLARPGEMLTREEICRELWPDGTFVDYEHGVNSAINRLREALGDKASSPRFVETLARRGYRFLASVEPINAYVTTPDLSSSGPTQELSSRPEPPQKLSSRPNPPQKLSSRPERSAVERPVVPATTTPPTLTLFDNLLATPEDLPKTNPTVVRNLFLALQLMYLAFYVGALANLPELNELFAPLAFAHIAFTVMIVSATLLIPVRIFLLCAVLFHAPAFREKFLRLWPFVLLPLDALWSLAPFLLLHHISTGLALACMTPLVYSPFAQRSLILMGAGGVSNSL